MSMLKIVGTETELRFDCGEGEEDKSFYVHGYDIKTHELLIENALAGINVSRGLSRDRYMQINYR